MSAIVNLPEAQRSAKIAELCKAGDLEQLKAVLEVATDDSTLVATGKPILMQILKFASDNFVGDVSQPLCEGVLSVIQRRQGRFNEEAVNVREILADHYQGSDRFKDCIGILCTIPMDTGLRSAEPEYKVSVWVRIAEIAMSIDDETTADTWITKAWPYSKHVKDPALRLRFFTIFAEVQDFKRKFIDAACRFYELSHEDIEDHVPALKKATVCILLAEVGPRRSRLLQTLMSDERMDAIGELRQILSKVYHSRILRPKDIEMLQPHLLTHHKAMQANGKRVIENAVMQHNLLSASKLYYNISFNELGGLLGVSGAEAERVCAKMAAEDRLKATIDQVDEMIIFAADISASIHQWDTQISAACNGVATIADSIVQQYPQYAPLFAQ